MRPIAAPPLCRGYARSSLLRLVLLGFGGWFLASGFGPTPASAQAAFRRGDPNQDTEVDLSDATTIFGWLFTGLDIVDCLDTLDTNDDGSIDLSDGLFLLNFLFAGGTSPTSPGVRGCGTDPTPDSLDCRDYSLTLCGSTLGDTQAAGQVLNRIAYGPSPQDLEWIRDLGIASYLESQLRPDTIDESDNTALLAREDELFRPLPLAEDTPLVSFREEWRYRKGSAQPPFGWLQPGFDDSAWLRGLTPLGYGRSDLVTVLDDMRENYLSVYLRRTFVIDDPATVETLVLRMVFDDGFVAYLNNTEIARANLPGIPGIPPVNTTTAISVVNSGEFSEFDVTRHASLLRPGENVLAIQVHNSSLMSSDLLCRPELLSRVVLGADRRVIRNPRALEQLPHVRGVYSRRQLQAVLAEFWENHFTTDLDKVVRYLEALQGPDAVDALSATQAANEAAQVEYLEHQFFYQNALGNFSDLLLYSATSPSMLIYLDNVLNIKSAPNENYAREFLELSAFGVDNRYTQRDIEELAKCFTGWTVCKISPSKAQDFPLNATAPPVEWGPTVTETELVPLGATWQLFKGTREPSPEILTGLATTAWTATFFNASDATVWIPVATGIGYGDEGNTTQLDDMQNGYTTVYIRHEFILNDPTTIEDLILWIVYDDAYVAYLNGTEISRSATAMPTSRLERMPPTFDDLASAGRGISEGPDFINVNEFRHVLRTGTNVLAVQGLNCRVASNDFSLRPRLLARSIASDAIRPRDPLGVWTFCFDPSQHNLEPKQLFQGTPYEIDIPGGRTGLAGLRDALEVVESAADHPSAAEFICIKLIQRFVSDEISLALFKNAPESIPFELRGLLAEMIAAWNETTPKGNIENVLRVLLAPSARDSAFWTDVAYRSKVKTPVEYINSSLRALEAEIVGLDLPDQNAAMGMTLFTRDDPDGWPEVGPAWVDTSSLLARMEFVRALSENVSTSYGWDALDYVDRRGLGTAAEIVDFFDDLLFEKTLHPANRTLFVEYLTTDTSGNTLDFSRDREDFRLRLETFIGLLLSSPQWQFQ